MEFDPEDANNTDWPQAYPGDWLPGNTPGYQGLVGGVPVDPTEMKKYGGPGTGNFGPHCRNCHRGSSDCAVCHEAGAKASSDAQAAMNKDQYGDFYAGGTWLPKSTFDSMGTDLSQYWRHERTVEWQSDWRTNPGVLDSTCSNDGFSWPHRTLGFKLLKDEMWGLDFDGTLVSVGETRNGIPDYISSDGNAYQMTTSSLPSKLYNKKAEDLDSACLDCHNPGVWNVVDMGDSTDLNNRKDRTTTAVDDYNDELLLRGLP